MPQMEHIGRTPSIIDEHNELPMPVSYADLMAFQRNGLIIDYTDRDSILYALSVGMGRLQVDEQELPYVFEGVPMKTVPTMATVLMGGAVINDSGLDFTKVLHGEQRLRLHRPIPPSGRLVVSTGVASVIDKGREKGSVILFEARAQTPDHVPVFETTTVILARGDGGIGGPPGSLEPPAAIPDRMPDAVCALEIRKDQALLYRLNDDLNPLHVDPKRARLAGFDAPILHGLCAYGVACKAILQTVCDYDHSRIGALNVRFSAPIYPGETIETQIWADGRHVSFRCVVPSRGVTVLDNGWCELEPVVS